MSVLSVVSVVVLGLVAVVALVNDIVQVRRRQVERWNRRQVEAAQDRVNNR